MRRSGRRSQAGRADGAGGRLSQGNRRRLLDGLDEIALTMQSADLIRAYETTRRQQEPWLFEPSVAEEPRS